MTLFLRITAGQPGWNVRFERDVRTSLSPETFYLSPDTGTRHPRFQKSPCALALDSETITAGGLEA